MIHIVFQEADIAALQAAFQLDSSIDGQVWHIQDDYAVGPIVDIYHTEGYQTRRDWWKQQLEYSPYVEQLDMVNDKLTVHNLQKELAEGVEVWIWMGQNQHDVCGYYWLMSQLKDYQGLISVLYLNNLPFINEKGQIFYPTRLSEISPKEFIKAKKLARVITLSEFEVDPDEWTKLMQENGGVRILEGGKKLVSKPENYYDAHILSTITADGIKLQKLISQVLQKIKSTTGDVFLVGRIKSLALENKLVIRGDWNKGWKDIEVATPAATQTAAGE